MWSKNSVAIQGHRGVALVVSAAAAITDILTPGVYDVVCDVDVSIRVSSASASPDRPQDVTRANGYRIAAGNSIPVEVGQGGCKIGAIADGAGTLYYHKIGN